MHPGLSTQRNRKDTVMMKGGLLWLLGIPLPIILLLFMFGAFH
jgi:hypothetical protein